MPYGNGHMLGSSIDTRNMQVDFSPIERAGQMMGNAFDRAGAQIGDMIKLHKEGTKKIDDSIKLGGMIAKMIPEAEPLATQAVNQLTNPDVSRREKLAYADTMNEMLKIGILRQDQDYKNRLLGLEKMKIELGSRGHPQEWKLVDIHDGTGGTIQGSYNPITRAILDLNGQPIGGGSGQPPMPQQQNDISGLPPEFANIPPVTGEQIRQHLGPNGVGVFPQEIQGMLDIQSQIRQNPANNGVRADGGAGVLPPKTQYEGGVRADGGAGVLPPKTQYEGRVGYSPPSTKTPLVNVSNEGSLASGYQRIRGADGSVRDIPIPGSSADLAEKIQQAKLESELASTQTEKLKNQALVGKGELAKDIAKINSNIVIQDTNRAMAEMKNTIVGDNPVAASARWAASFLPGTAEYKVKNNYLRTITSQVTLDSLQKMREASPTGGALGNVSDNDAKLLAASKGALSESQDLETFQKNATRLQSIVLDIAHGTREARAKLVESGKLNPDVNAAIEAQYPAKIMDSQGNMIDRNPKSTQPSDVQPASGSLLSPEAKKLLDSIK